MEDLGSNPNAPNHWLSLIGFASNAEPVNQDFLVGISP